MGRSATSLFVRLAPILFVGLWATGFVGAKYGMRGAEPFTFLAIRFALTFLILLPFVVFLFGEELRKRDQLLHSFFAGCLLHGVYLGGVFYAIDRGLAAGLSSLLVSLQPFCTVFFSYWLLSEKAGPGKLAFFALSLAGAALVLLPGADTKNLESGISIETIAACGAGVIAISLGAVYQKRHVTDLNLLVSTFAQFAGGAVTVAIMALLTESGEIQWLPEVVFSMIWLVFVLSIGAVVLLMVLIRRGSSNSVATLFYLVPVVSMFMTWVLFDERLVAMQWLGAAMVVAGVAFASRVK
ncbi:MAG: DMT family transporter [Pseudomonadota bacterium]